MGDGFISITLTNSTDVDLSDVTWRQGEDENGPIIATGPNLTEADAGTYYVTVTTTQGCSSGQAVELKSDIRPFNGISRNGDGMNDFFMIKCLEQFQDNIVRIYNRAGTLVFEAENYDNIDIYFDGISNKGISPMGNNLPDGTYFYIIDKRDGSKPIAGYLEIVN
jgi:gliding motility-associated-like protein